MSWLSKRPTIDWMLLVLTGAFAVRWVLYGDPGDAFVFMLLYLPLLMLRLAEWADGGD